MRTAFIQVRIEVPGNCRSQVARDVARASAVALAGLVREVRIERPAMPATYVQRLMVACGWRRFSVEKLHP